MQEQETEAPQPRFMDPNQGRILRQRHSSLDEEMMSTKY